LTLNAKKYHHFKLKIQPSPHLLMLIETYVLFIMGSFNLSLHLEIEIVNAKELCHDYLVR